MIPDDAKVLSDLLFLLKKDGSMQLPGNTSLTRASLAKCKLASPQLEA